MAINEDIGGGGQYGWRTMSAIYTQIHLLYTVLYIIFTVRRNSPNQMLQILEPYLLTSAPLFVNFISGKMWLLFAFPFT